MHNARDPLTWFQASNNPRRVYMPLESINHIDTELSRQFSWPLDVIPSVYKFKDWIKISVSIFFITLSKYFIYLFIPYARLLNLI